jgi:hypothetical protein
VPTNADPSTGPVSLKKLDPAQGFLGQNWDLATGGYQQLPVAPLDQFSGDRPTASWLPNAAYAADWQRFQAEGRTR